MTDREMYVAIVTGNITDEVIEKAQGKIDALDARKVKTAEKNAEKYAEVDATVIEALTADPQTASEIAAVLGDEFNTSKVTASCKRLAAAGKVAVGEVANKGRIVKSYALA